MSLLAEKPIPNQRFQKLEEASFPSFEEARQHLSKLEKQDEKLLEAGSIRFRIRRRGQKNTTYSVVRYGRLERAQVETSTSS